MLYAYSFTRIPGFAFFLRDCDVPELGKLSFVEDDACFLSGSESAILHQERRNGLDTFGAGFCQVVVSTCLNPSLQKP